MNQHRRRSARAIAIAKTDETRTRTLYAIAYSSAALVALSTLIAIWSF